MNQNQVHGVNYPLSGIYSRKLQINHLIKSLLTIILAITLTIVSNAQSQVMVSFSRGSIGTIGNNSNTSLNPLTFPTLGVTRAYFVQNSTTGLFTAQGNDIPGTVRLMLTSGSSVDINGAINWRGPSGNIEYFGFIPDPAITPVTLNLPSGGTFVITGTSNFALLKNGSTFTLNDNTTLTGNAATTGILDGKSIL